MVRGCEKRIYYVKNPESEMFDEAYLILRRGVKSSTQAPGELELEAMRILRGSDKASYQPVRKRYENMKAFFAGAAMSGLFIGALGMLLWLIL